MAIKYELLLSRIPFLSVVILPFILGSFAASYFFGKFNLVIFLFGILGAMFIQLATYYSGELYDIKEDRLSITLEKNFFPGGSQVLVKSMLAPKKVKILTEVFVFLVLIIGIILQFYLQTGRWTLLLGISGLLCGLFYFKPPLRWVRPGVGEILVAYTYGWLAINAGFYIQTGHFNFLITWISLPVVCSIVNIILINEYPDYLADKAAGKMNLLVRRGKIKVAILYAFLVNCSAVTFLLALVFGYPVVSGIFYFPVFILAIILAGQMLRGDYNDRIKLEKICKLTLLVSLGTSLSCILGLLVKKL